MRLSKWIGYFIFLIAGFGCGGQAKRGPFMDSKHDKGVKYMKDPKMVYMKMLSASDSARNLLFFSLGENYENEIIPIPYQEVLLISHEDSLKQRTDINGEFHLILNSGSTRVVYKNSRYYLDTLLNLSKGSINHLTVHFDFQESKLLYMGMKKEKYTIESLF